MFSIKLHRTVKGYVVIYILFFGIASMMMMLLAFKMQLDLKRYMNNSIDNSLKQEKDLRYKEHLFTFFKKDLLNNNVSISKDSIMDFLNEDNIYLNIDFENSLLTFDKKEQLLLITYPFDRYYNRIDYFNFSVDNGKLQFYMERSEIKEK